MPVRSYPLVRTVALLCLLGGALAACDAATPDEVDEPTEALAGGATTVFEFNSHAFSTPAPNLSPEELERHLEGDFQFEAAFVTAPAELRGGLGPVFNEVACVQCHARDGRSIESLLLRISVDGAGPNGEPVPVPGFGTQIQDRAIFGYAPEAEIGIAYTTRTETLADGTTVTLREPVYQIGASYQPLPAHVLVSPRIARPVFGLGLLEAVSDRTVEQLADRQAADGEVSGRPNRVWDPIEGRTRIGRFGWKANQPSLLVQNAAAYHGDMGITSPLFSLESSDGQDGHADGLGDDPEIGQDVLDSVTFYTQTLGVPARRNLDHPDVQRGKRIFLDVGCASCHVPQLQTGTLSGVPAVSDQTIYPYTDLLLHDMGEGLADGRPDFEATGREWRTPPLWGLGLTEVVNGNPQLLHDGRARSLWEAIFWHGGEAAPALERVRTLTTEEHDDLLAFLRSL